MKPKYKVGDRVKLKDKLLFNLSDLPARKYAGAVMTVRETITHPDGSAWYYRMEEDCGECLGEGWPWFDEEIAGYAADFEDPEALDDSTLPQITFEELLASTLPERRSS